MSNKSKFYIFLTIFLLLFTGVGFYYVKPSKVLNQRTVYQLEFEDVSGLVPGAGVRLRGVLVGRVTDVFVDNAFPSVVIVQFTVDNQYKIPKDAQLFMKSGGIVTGNFLAIVFDKQCVGSDCANENFTFKASDEGALSALLGDDPLQTELGLSIEDREEVKKIAQSKFLASDSDNMMAQTLKNIELINNQMTDLGKKMNAKTEEYSQQYQVIMRNLKGLSSTMKNAQVQALKNDLERITAKMDNLDLETVTKQTNKTKEKVTLIQKEVANTLKLLQETTVNANDVFQGLDKIKAQMNADDSSMEYFLAKDGLYKDLDETMKKVDLLNKDVKHKPYQYIPFSSRRKTLKKQAAQ